MFVIAREICRQENQALAHEWLISNGEGSYASASIAGALTRRQHGLLVTRELTTALPVVALAKIDEEVELEGQVIKLGTNEYFENVVNPDGFLYLQQVTFDGAIAEFIFESGRFQLTKTIWMEYGQQTTYIRYALAEHSARVRLTLVPLCDDRTTDRVTGGSPDRRIPIEIVPRGIHLLGHDGTVLYRLLTEPRASFTPLELWYWRFQLRRDENVTADLFVPGLFRADMEPGNVLTLIATRESDDAIDFDVSRAFSRARARDVALQLPSSDKFTAGVFSAPGL